MVDTYDLFKKLSDGAKFDFKRFKGDADRFKVSDIEILVKLNFLI